MVRTKKQSKQRGVGSVDFKKIKRKIGRKLPPPKNATNTEIKSKAIVLPEQSVAVNKEGLAVNKKGLTLKELLHQSSHHNAKTRKDALAGIKDLLIKHPTELWGYGPTIVKLRERIRDTDKNVREALYHLLKTVVLPWSKEENQHGLVDLVVPYIFIAMASLSVEVRLMAFKYFDLVVEYHPTTFSLYSEQILQRYEEILQNSQFYVGDKKNLKTALEGLVRCLSLLPGKKEKPYPWDPDLRGRRLLHGYYARDESEEPIGSNVVKKIKDLLPVLINCFQEFTPLIQNTQELDAKTFDCMLHILQSISLSFKLLVSGKYEDRPENCPFGRPDTDLSDEKIVSTILKKLLASFPLSRSNYASEKEEDKFLAPNSIITEIFFYLRNWICHHRDSLEKYIQVISRWTRRPDMLLKRFLEFIESALSGKICSGDSLKKANHVKYLLPLLHLVPELVSQAIPDLNELHGESELSTGYELVSRASNLGPRLLQAFTMTFENCHPESKLKLACLSAIEEMMQPVTRTLWNLDAVDPDFRLQKIWIHNVVPLLHQLGDKNPSSSKAVLYLFLRLGHKAPANRLLAIEHDRLQNELCHFFSNCGDKGNVIYGLFMRLDPECQKLAIFGISFFKHLNRSLLDSVQSCCICEELNPYTLDLAVGVLHNAYKDGRIRIEESISFVLGVVANFKFYPENDVQVRQESANTSRHRTFRWITKIIRSCLSQMGGPAIMLRLIKDVIISVIGCRPLPNVHALLGLLVQFDSEPTRLSKQNIIKLGEELPKYMYKVLQLPGGDNGTATSIISRQSCLEPCSTLFKRSPELLNLVIAKIAEEPKRSQELMNLLNLPSRPTG